MRSGTRAAAVAGTVVLAAVSAAACGPGGGGSHPGAASATGGSAGAGRAVQTAYKTTIAHAKAAAFRLSETIQANGAAGSSQHATLTGQGQADLVTHAFTVTLNAPGGGSIRVVLMHGIEYVQLPAAARSQIPGHKPWVSVDLNKVSQAKLGASFSQVAAARSDNPAQALTQLSGVSSRVSKVGSAAVAGVPTTEYRARSAWPRSRPRPRPRPGRWPPRVSGRR